MTSLPETRASLILRLPDAADVLAWDQFAAIYGPLVYRLARKQGLQPADADDLVQEVFSAVARSVQGWLDNGERGPFRAWLLRIAKNTAINFLTRPRHQAVAAGGSETMRRLSQLADSAAEDGGEFDLEYRRELFRWAADQLRDVVSESTWQAFWRTSVEEQPIEAVAKGLKVSVGSVYIARSRVMARLRELVQSFGENER
jgi:RNA polymerase sigma-70 factor (ECF subfamily)